MCEWLALLAGGPTLAMTIANKTRTWHFSCVSVPVCISVCMWITYESHKTFDGLQCFDHTIWSWNHSITLEITFIMGQHLTMMLWCLTLNALNWCLGQQDSQFLLKRLKSNDQKRALGRSGYLEKTKHRDWEERVWVRCEQEWTGKIYKRHKHNTEHYTLSTR